MGQLQWKKHPFRLLLYLEWILLGIALLAIFSAVFTAHHRPPPRFPIPHRAPNVAMYRERFLFATLLSMMALGFSGARLPFGSRWVQGVYIGFGFAMSWMVILLGGRAERVFPALLLVVAIRACVLFPWSGRIVVALLAYSSFLSALVISWLGVRPFGIPLARPLPPGLRRLPRDELQKILVALNFNTALLFGFVLTFVLLLVGAVLAEQESRERLMRANHRLRQYAAMVESQATLEERNRIAREIHDSVGHYLTAQSIQLENVALFLSEDPQRARDRLQKARQLGKEALENVRHSVATLRNHPLKGRSLAVALEELMEEFKRTTGIEMKSRIYIASSLSTEVTAALYRTTQEALTNIAKHSQATQASLSLEEREGKIYLQVVDNGCGFDPGENTTGFGLRGMRERVEMFGGRWRAIAQPGRGCTILVELPILGAIARSVMGNGE
ncbi:MAG: sensor histidine kinase [Cyanobacteriota bacterium]|nr:sensor histidine kinase [Cyanobacteriota bacterium]